jgi:hypothetical protein
MKSKLISILNKALSNNVFIIVISCALFLMIEIPILTNSRPIFCDEAWYSNPAYNFSQGQGIHNTNVGSGGDMNFVFPFIQGILFAIFGYSIFLARFASVLAGLFSIVVLYKILKQLELPNKAAVFGLIALIVIPVYHSIFRYARPESWAILFVLFSLLFFIKYIYTFSNKNILYTGIFCALGFLTHPFTLSVLLAIGLMLFIHSLKNKRIIPLIIFTIPVIISIAIFILNSIYLLDGTKLYTGFGRVNTIDAGYLNRIGNNLKVIFSHYFMHKHAIYFIPLILLLLLGLFLKKKNRLVFYSSLMGSLVFCISIILFKNDVLEKLMFYVLVFSILNFALLINTKISKYILIAISAYLILMLFANIYYDIKKYEPVNSLLEKKLQIIILENARVMGPLEFWMFIPKTQFKSTYYRWQHVIDFKRLPSEFEYFLLFSKDGNNIYQNVHDINQIFKQCPGSKLIYETYSKNYGKIELYSLKNQNDSLQ